MNNPMSAMQFLLSLTNDDAKDHPVKLTVGDLKEYFKYVEHIGNLYNIATEDINKLQQRIVELEQTIKNMNENSRRW